MQSARGESLKGACADVPGIAGLLETAESRDTRGMAAIDRYSRQPGEPVAHIDGSERKSVSSVGSYQEVE